MPTVNDSELVRFVAEKCMGWRYYETEGGYKWWEVVGYERDYT